MIEHSRIRGRRCEKSQVRRRIGLAAAAIGRTNDSPPSFSFLNYALTDDNKLKDNARPPLMCRARECAALLREYSVSVVGATNITQPRRNTRAAFSQWRRWRCGDCCCCCGRMASHRHAVAVVVMTVIRRGALIGGEFTTTNIVVRRVSAKVEECQRLTRLNF